MLDIGFHDAVEHVVRRQAVLVGLVRPQFRRGARVITLSGITGDRLLR